MDTSGLSLCCRYSYPPNSLSLCGPEKQKDLEWYTGSQNIDGGTKEILSQFSTLYPYLCLIAYENDMKDPFDRRVVEAYWLGNNLLKNISIRPFVAHLSDTLALKKKIKREELENLSIKIGDGALPNHAFHVLNIYKRTGHMDIPHTVETMDACIINWGKVAEIGKNKIIISTQPLTKIGDILGFGPVRKRTLMMQGSKDEVVKDIKPGDWVSYHWGYVCQKLNEWELKNLIYYTELSLRLANI